MSEGNPEVCQTQNEKLIKEENESRRRENNRISESSNSRKMPKMENSSAEKKSSPIVDIKCKTKSSKYKIVLNGEDDDEPKKDLNRGSWTQDHSKEKKHESKKTEPVSGVTKKQKKLEKSLKETGDACKKEKRKARDKPTALEIEGKVEDICENPSMSFEAYLSYDLEPPKRKKCFNVSKNSKRMKATHKESSSVSLVKMSKAVTEEPITAVHQKQVRLVFFSKHL